eukprot:m.783453 g.783453  ORF g.783453 m.783453 type:complete len:126 (-) comp59153_c0_seq24:114-491(-)
MLSNETFKCHKKGIGRSCQNDTFKEFKEATEIVDLCMPFDRHSPQVPVMDVGAMGEQQVGDGSRIGYRKKANRQTQGSVPALHKTIVISDQTFTKVMEGSKCANAFAQNVNGASERHRYLPHPAH